MADVDVVVVHVPVRVDIPDVRGKLPALTYDIYIKYKLSPKIFVWTTPYEVVQTTIREYYLSINFFISPRQ